jgi:predicted nucleic acid-binding protein
MSARLQVLPFGVEAARTFGEVKAQLRKRMLTKSDVADLQIVATAIVEDAVLVTDDGALLDGSIPGLKAENAAHTQNRPPPSHSSPCRRPLESLPIRAP